MKLIDEAIVKISQELDVLLNKFYSGIITIQEVNKKKEELHNAIDKIMVK
jgi:hypothetical protein